MSVSTMVETYDMPMTDYNEDGDIPMAGSSENWFQPLPKMDEDAHHIGPFSDSQEVDMMAFEETTTEYEMADEAVQLQDTDLDANVLDAEVYDAAIHPSPLPTEQEIVGHHDEQSGLSGAGGSTIVQPQLEGDPHAAMTHDDDSSDGRHFVAPDMIQSRDVLLLVDDTYGSGRTSVPHVSEGDFDGHTEQQHTEEPTTATVPSSSEGANTEDAYSSSHLDRIAASLQHDEQEAQANVNSEADGTAPDPSAADGRSQTNEDAGEVVSEHADIEEASQALKVAEESAGNTGETGAEHSELNANQQVYLHPPPSIQLSLQVTSAEGDQPEFVLFSLPESSSHATEEPLVLLQHNPSLFYEPVSAVFDAFRQEEYFSHIEELSEAEMALNAHELQLVISEDNIYSREVSLQDLYAMHQGVALPGHLRLTLQSIVPRFITRYNHLRDQITRRVLGDEVVEATELAEYVVNGEEEREAPEQEVQALVSSDEPREASDHDDADAEPEALQGSENGELHAKVVEVEESGGAVHAEADERDERGQGEVSEYDDDASGESDDAAYELDAGAIHVKDAGDGAEPSVNEYYTGLAHEAELREEGDEGYGDDFRDVGAEGTGTIEDATEPAVAPDAEETELFTAGEQQESAPPSEAQSGKISHSTSTSSFDADLSTWEEEGEEDDDSQGLEQETNHSIQQTSASVFDEEGNLAEEAEEADDHDSGGNEFGNDGFDESAESTLEDPSEEAEATIHNNAALEDVDKDADASSLAILAESENFVSKLADDSRNFEVIKDLPSDDGVGTDSPDPSTTITTPSKTRMVDKNAPKRSLDVADLDDGEVVSSSSSPDSKRTRTL